MVKMRPVLGSTATTEPLYLPRPSTTALRTMGSSKVGSSVLKESAYVGTPRKRNTRWCTRELILDLVFECDFDLVLSIGRAAGSAAGTGTASVLTNIPVKTILDKPLLIRFVFHSVRAALSLEVARRYLNFSTG